MRSQFKKIEKLLGTLYLPLGWTIIIIILLCLPGSMMPEEKGFEIPNFDKFVHFILFGVLVLLWCFYYFAKKTALKISLLIYFIIFLSSCTMGISLEYVQKYFIPNRDFELGDIIADLIGSSIAYGFCNIFLIRNPL
ncbi:MAG: VanZ family protein [Bacteroidetes bacterium]|nr:VanZ family protein [Bacteroidota bacterium]